MFFVGMVHMALNAQSFCNIKKRFATKMQGHGNLQLTQVGVLWSFKSTKLIGNTHHKDLSLNNTYLKSCGH
jgi:hypothetical protein